MKEHLNALQQLAVDSAEDKKAFDILILDLRNRSDLTDFFMICSGMQLNFQRAFILFSW